MIGLIILGIIAVGITVWAFTHTPMQVDGLYDPEEQEFS